MDTHIPEGFKLTWSHSTLNSFETCPLKYWAEKIVKMPQPPVHPTTEWGIKVHKALEDNGKVKKPMPSNMSQYEGYAKSIRDTAAMVQIAKFEHKMAIDTNWNACGFFDANVYGRAVADVMLVNPDRQTGAIIDHKFGSYRGPSTQGLINAYFMMKEYPEIEIVHTRFNYVKEDKSVKEVFYRSSIDDDFQQVKNLIDELTLAVTNNNFQARKSGLCRSFCSNTKCAFNGNYKG